LHNYETRVDFSVKSMMRRKHTETTILIDSVCLQDGVCAQILSFAIFTLPSTMFHPTDAELDIPDIGPDFDDEYVHPPIAPTPSKKPSTVTQAPRKDGKNCIADNGAAAATSPARKKSGGKDAAYKAKQTETNNKQKQRRKQQPASPHKDDGQPPKKKRRVAVADTEDVLPPAGNDVLKTVADLATCSKCSDICMKPVDTACCRLTICADCAAASAECEDCHLPLKTSPSCPMVVGLCGVLHSSCDAACPHCGTTDFRNRASYVHIQTCDQAPVDCVHCNQSLPRDHICTHVPCSEGKCPVVGQAHQAEPCCIREMMMANKAAEQKAADAEKKAVAAEAKAAAAEVAFAEKMQAQQRSNEAHIKQVEVEMAQMRTQLSLLVNATLQ
jgi:hypothetical protein